MHQIDGKNADRKVYLMMMMFNHSIERDFDETIDFLGPYFNNIPFNRMIEDIAVC